MSNPWSRIFWFLVGNQSRAEALDDTPDPKPVAWVQPGATAGVIDYALEAALRSAEKANAAVDRVQDKAAAQVVLVVGLVPFSAAATGLAIATHGGAAGLRLGAIIAFGLADALLLGSAVMAFLAAGLVVTVGLNIGRLSTASSPKEEDLKRTEALTWHKSAWNAMVTVQRRAGELFRSRRLLLWALLIAAVGASLLGLASSNH
ncbi:MAG: hypothetical protein M3Q23_18020 [Actinomycetota bacterium]|nr:hypothetical protein [Actinomycetota bacterium]